VGPEDSERGGGKRTTLWTEKEGETPSSDRKRDYDRDWFQQPKEKRETKGGKWEHVSDLKEGNCKKSRVWMRGKTTPEKISQRQRSRGKKSHVKNGLAKLELKAGGERVSTAKKRQEKQGGKGKGDKDKIEGDLRGPTKRRPTKNPPPPRR